jgi:hypothetical protein
MASLLFVGGWLMLLVRGLRGGTNNSTIIG